MRASCASTAPRESQTNSRAPPGRLSTRTRSAQRKLADWAAHWDQGREPAYAAAARAHREAYYDMLLAIDKTLRAEQRVTATTRFRSFAQEFQLLAGAGSQSARTQ